MKKQLSKLTLKTDKIVALSKAQAQQVAGGRPAAATKYANGQYCPTSL
ncbi:class I lanthipeptide [Larkinella sp. VNQ87]